MCTEEKLFTVCRELVSVSWLHSELFYKNSAAINCPASVHMAAEPHLSISAQLKKKTLSSK